MRKKRNNKWLLRKVSGSRAKYAYKPDYSETRNKKYRSIEDLPQRESIGKGHSFLDTSLVKRWLYKQVGNDFDEIYSEFLTRIQPKYKEEYKDCIYDYVVHPNFENNSSRINKPFFICKSSNLLKRFEEYQINESKEQLIENDLGKFRFHKEEKNWVSSGHPKLWFKENFRNLSSKQISEILELLEKKDRLELKAIEEINGFAEKHAIQHVINGTKELFRIDFKQITKILKFDMYFEVSGNASRDWIVSFSNFNIDDVVLNKK